MKKNTFLSVKAIVLLLFFSTGSFSQCFTKLSTGSNHTIGMKPNGTIWTWGNGSAGWGNLGLIDDNDAVVPTQPSTASNWQFITAGTRNSFGIKTNGTLWGTGSDIFGELGDGTFGSSNAPHSLIQIGSATTWSAISANDYHTIGLRTNGTLWSWGLNNEGQLGNGTTVDKHIPTQIGTENSWKTITTGQAFCIAIKTDGTMWGWGSNGSGCLGIGDISFQGTSSPIQSGTANDWRTVTSGPSSFIVMAIKNNGKLYSFGGVWNSGEGGLGLGLDVHAAAAPSQVGTDSDWYYVSVGYNNTFGIKTNGTLWSWGQNNYGQLGDGTTVDKGFPVQIGSDTNWASVVAGNGHTVALKTDGSSWAWGNGSYGQQGNGSYSGSLVPVQMVVTGCTLATNDFNTTEINAILSPNPAKNEVTLFVKDNIAFDNLEVYDVSGRLVLKTKAAAQSGSFTFNVSGLSRGVYSVVVKDGEKRVLVEKMVKE